MIAGNHTLVILIPGFPEREEDTTCLPAQQAFIRALNHAFPSIRLIILSFQYPSAPSAYHWHGNQVISFGINGGFYRKLQWMHIWERLRQIKKENNILGLLSFWCTECALIGKYFGRFYGIKHYCWVCGQDARKENKLVRFIRPKSRELIAMSDSLAKEFYKNHGIRPHCIIPNGIDTTQFKEPSTGRDIDILGAGSLISLKQYQVFLDIVSALSAHFPQLKAMICGKGAEEPRLQAQIAALNIHDLVSLAGECPHPEIIRLMQRTRVFLHPSSYEGFSTACIEALYAGAQVISFCSPMTQNPRHWHIVNNKEEMLQKAAELLRDPQLDHERVMAYSMEDSARSMMKLFGQ